jgi:Domain of unknown function (DUF4091)
LAPESFIVRLPTRRHNATIAAVLFAFAAQSCCNLQSSTPNKQGTMLAGALDAMTRVGLDEPIKVSSSMHLYAARGEYESFQIAVTANDGPVESVSMAVSDLRSGDSSIDRSNLTVYREHFVQVKKGSPDFGGANRPLGPGLYADALIPLNDGRVAAGHARFSATPVKIDPQHRAVFWIDVFVPREARAGEYDGEVTVSSASGKATIPVALSVWRHTLPLRPSLKSSFGIDSSRNRDRRTAELLLKHKLMPFLIEPAQSTEYRDNFGLNATGLWFFGDANNRACTIKPAPPIQAIRNAMALYPGDVEKYEYAADEIDCTRMFPSLKQWARNVHQAGAKMLVTMIPTPDLLDDGAGKGRSAVDIWVLLPKMYKQAGPLIQQVLRKGDEVWSYNCLWQDTYSPKWEIDASPINYRIQPGFLNQSLGITGLLYWGVDRWNDDPWEDGASYKESGYTFPGEGLLVYPGAAAGMDGPVPSMRLKWIRKGVEDYEYVEMLKRTGRGEWALSVIRGVASDWDSWTRSTEDLQEVRRKLGEALDRLEALKSGPPQSEPHSPSRSQTIH